MEETKLEEKKNKLAQATFTYLGGTSPYNPWSPSDIDKMESPNHDNFPKLVKECRFFYRKDPIASTVINKMVDLSLTDLVIERGKLSINEIRIFDGIKDELLEFLESCALEYLISGLIIPEIKYAPVSSEKVKKLGVKKYSTVILPVEMWLRDPASIKINWSYVLNKPSYYLRVPDKLVFFLLNKGRYEDGTEDKDLYNELLKYYPAFVEKVLSGEKEILLENELIVRRRTLSDSPYPSPYLNSALESLKHKRNLKRLDYSLAARAIGAIQQFKVGNDEYPVTEDDAEAFNSLKDQMLWRDSSNTNVERIFQLFTNHTVEIGWVYPPLEALIDDKKYSEVNEDIFLSLGFPRILTTGESLRTGTSDPEYATLSPVKTMLNMQKKLLFIVNGIIKDVAKLNNLSETPNASFKPISIVSFKNFVDGLRNLYDTSNISRSTYAEAFGYNFEEEARKLKEDTTLVNSLGIDPFAPKPHSNQPGQGDTKPSDTKPSGGQ